MDHVRQKIYGSSPMLVLGVFGNNDTCVGKYKPAYFEITDTRFKDLNKFSCCVLLLYLNSFAGSKFWKYFVQWRRTYSNLIVVFFFITDKWNQCMLHIKNINLHADTKNLSVYRKTTKKHNLWWNVSITYDNLFIKTFGNWMGILFWET